MVDSRNRWVRLLAAFGFISVLGACSVSMPMPGFVDETSTGSIVARTSKANPPSPEPLKPVGDGSDDAAEK